MALYPTTYSLSIPVFFFLSRISNTTISPCIWNTHVYWRALLINNLNVVKIHASCFSLLLNIQDNYICKLQGNKVSLSSPTRCLHLFKDFRLAAYFRLKYNLKNGLSSFLPKQTNKKNTLKSFNGGIDCLCITFIQDSIKK